MPAHPSAEVNALLGRGSEFEGKLTFEGTVRIDGKFSGEIFSEDTLIIGEGARVKAEIAVATVIIYGDVVGNIRSKNSVELHAPARLKGNILAPALVVEQGVIFDGNCQMTASEGQKRAGQNAAQAPVQSTQPGSGITAIPVQSGQAAPPPPKRPDPAIL